VRIFAAKRNKFIFEMKKIFSLFVLFLLVQAANAYEVSVTMFQVNDSTWNFNVCLGENDMDFTAFQMDIALEGEAAVPETGLSCDTLLCNHNLMLGAPEGKHRIIAYSTDSTPFKSQNGKLLSFIVKGSPRTISIDNILFAEPDATLHAAADVTAVAVEDPTGITGVAVTGKNAEGAYDLSGRKVAHRKNGAVFVIDGKKILVK
jgi:hypothetical protein